MAHANPKIVLSRSQDIPFNKLVLSQANVRRVKAGISIDELAEDIAQRTLLQGLSVRPVLDADGEPTGMFEVPAGGRRYRALELLVRQKRMTKTQPVPCVVRESGLASEDSLAENVQRVALHPLDQFRAFRTLLESGLGEEEIAARFFVTPAVVKQRLKLAAASPKLLDLYTEDEMSLEQLMAFTVTTDHARQEQVWDALAHSHNREPYYIRRHLTEDSVRAGDKRAQFVGIEAYESAGGIILRDLFQQDDGGWLQDPALLDRLALEKLANEAETIRTEGWKWVEIAIEFRYGHAAGLRRLVGETIPLTDEEQARHDALRVEFDDLDAQYAQAEELPDDIDRRLGEIETALEAFDNRPLAYDPADIARAGVFVSIDGNGGLWVDRGYVRSEDEVAIESEPGADIEASEGEEPEAGAQRTTDGESSSPDAETPDEEDGIKPLPDRLVTELTAHRTLALRDALANHPDIAFVAVLHALCLTSFYRYVVDSCLEITAKSAGFSHQAPGLNDTISTKAIEARHQNWVKQLPDEPGELWDVLHGFDYDSQAALFAHCASLSINAVHEQWNRNPSRIAHADQIARATNLDMVAAGWVPTVDTYLGRVTKARILEAVRETKGDEFARLIEHLKKPDMAKEAERLLTDTEWLPEPLRTPTVKIDVPDAPTGEDAENPPVDDNGAAHDANDVAAE